MTRIAGPAMTTPVSWGSVRSAFGRHEVVGDRLVPEQVEVLLPGADGQPGLEMFIEVIDGVPRCTELLLKRSEGGREIRPSDLRRIDLETFIESFVGMVSPEIVEVDDKGGGKAVIRPGEEFVREGARVVRQSRKGSRRPMTDDRKQRVADVYNAHESGGIEAVELAFSVSRSTAIRYINAARDAGLIEKRAK